MADHVENDRAVAALFALAFVAMATPAGGILGCSFATMEQCQAAVSGGSGCCERDPFTLQHQQRLRLSAESPLAKSATHRARKPPDNQ
jgi:hypothetical protein